MTADERLPAVVVIAALVALVGAFAWVEVQRSADADRVRALVERNETASIANCDTGNILRAYLQLRASEQAATQPSPTRERLIRRSRSVLIVRDCGKSSLGHVVPASWALRVALIQRMRAGDPWWAIHDDQLVHRVIGRE